MSWVMSSHEGGCGGDSGENPLAQRPGMLCGGADDLGWMSVREGCGAFK